MEEIAKIINKLNYSAFEEGNIKDVSTHTLSDTEKDLSSKNAKIIRSIIAIMLLVYILFLPNQIETLKLASKSQFLWVLGGQLLWLITSLSFAIGTTLVTLKLFTPRSFNEVFRIFCSQNNLREKVVNGNMVRAESVDGKFAFELKNYQISDLRKNFVVFSLEFRLQNSLISTKINSRLSEISKISTSKNTDLIGLEGDFNDFFETQTEKNHGTETTTLLAPDFMNFLINEMRDYEIEVFGNSVIFRKIVDGNIIEIIKNENIFLSSVAERFGKNFRFIEKD